MTRIAHSPSPEESSFWGGALLCPSHQLPVVPGTWANEFAHATRLLTIVAMDIQGPVLVVGNPFSGTGDNRQRVERLTAALGGRGIECEVVWELDGRRVILGDRERVSGYRAVVVCGGDGTAGDVINEMLGCGADRDDLPPLGVMAGGNENLLSKGLGFPANVEKFAAVVAGGKVRRLDLGVVEKADGSSRYFSLMASAGYDAQVIHELAAWRESHKKDRQSGGGGVAEVAADGGEMESGGGGRHRKKVLKRVSRLSYLRPMLRSARKYRFPELTVRVDNGPDIDGYLVVVQNLTRYGPGLKLCDQVADDDGELNWIIFCKPGLLNVLKYIVAVVMGVHGRLGDVRTGRGRRVDIIGSSEVAVQADGDALGLTPVGISVQPGLLAILTD